jgi:hypothetical protein
LDKQRDFIKAYSAKPPPEHEAERESGKKLSPGHRMFVDRISYRRIRLTLTLEGCVSRSREAVMLILLTILTYACNNITEKSTHDQSRKLKSHPSSFIRASSSINRTLDCFFIFLHLPQKQQSNLITINNNNMFSLLSRQNKNECPQLELKPETEGNEIALFALG